MVINQSQFFIADKSNLHCMFLISEDSKIIKNSMKIASKCILSLYKIVKTFLWLVKHVLGGLAW